MNKILLVTLLYYHLHISIICHCQISANFFMFFNASSYSNAQLRISSISGITIGNNDTIFVSDQSNSLIRAIFSSHSPATATVTSYSFSRPAIKPSQLQFINGNLFVLDNGVMIWRVSIPSGNISAFFNASANSLSSNSSISSFTIDRSGNLFMTDSINNRIIMRSGNRVSVLAGAASAGDIDSQGTNARFRYPTSLDVDITGNIYVSDRDNNKLRKVFVSQGNVTTFVGSSLDGQGTSVQFDKPSFIVSTFDRTGLLLIDSFGTRVRKVDIASAMVTTIDLSSDILQMYLEKNPLVGVADDQYGDLYLAMADVVWKLVYCPIEAQFKPIAAKCQCNISYAHSSPKVCMKCPVGTESSFPGAESCVPCPQNKFRASIDDLSCIDCPADSVCTPTFFACSPGFEYSSALGKCTQCPTGQFKQHANNGRCSQCPLGTEPASNNTQCTSCPLGKWRPSDEFDKCIDCPDGATCTATSYTCLPGFTTPSSTPGKYECLKCDDGYYKDKQGNTACLPCQTGFFSMNDRRSCSKCPLGAQCSDGTFKCLPGYENDVTGVRCVACANGFAKTSLGNDGKCILCGVGTQSAPDKSKCEPCPSGQYKSIDTPAVNCVDCPEFSSECNADGFTCQEGYKKSETLCVISGKLGDDTGKLVTKMSRTAESMSNKQVSLDNSRSSFEWSRLYMYEITYIIGGPVIIGVTLLILCCFKFHQLRKLNYKAELKLMSSNEKLYNSRSKLNANESNGGERSTGKRTDRARV